MAPGLNPWAPVFGGILAFRGSPLGGTNLFVATATGLTPLQVSLRCRRPYSAGSPRCCWIRGSNSSRITRSTVARPG